jgi:hypothetical protein
VLRRVRSPIRQTPAVFEKGLETVYKKLQQLQNGRCRVHYVLGATWKDAAGQRDTISACSDALKGLLEDIRAEVALPAYVRSAEVARRLAFARAAGFSSLSIGLMQRADGVLLDLLMHDRRGSLLYSGSGEAVEPAHVHAVHGSGQQLPSPKRQKGVRAQCCRCCSRADAALHAGHPAAVPAS